MLEKLIDMLCWLFELLTGHTTDGRLVKDVQNETISLRNE